MLCKSKASVAGSLHPKNVKKYKTLLHVHQYIKNKETYNIWFGKEEENKQIYGR